MIESDYKFIRIKEYKERALKQQIYNIHNVKKYECCPYCGCEHFIKHGRYEGIQRYRCKNEGCRKTFSNTTFSVWKYLKHKPEKWISFIECMCENLTLELCSKILKISISTAFNWRHKVLHAVENYYDPENFKESVAINDFIIPKCYKGSRNKHFTYSETIENKTAKLYGYIPKDVKILISAENDKIPKISVQIKNETGSLQDVFQEDVLKKVEKDCYIHLYSIGKSELEQNIMKYNKNLSKSVRKKYGFKIRKNWVGIYHMTDTFQVSSSMRNFRGGLSSWIWHFKGIATKYIRHYYKFYSLVNSPSSFNYMKIFKELLKNGFYTSVNSLKITHPENY